MRRALGEFVVEGIKTNLDFHRRLIDHPDFVAGRLDTHFLERFSHGHADRSVETRSLDGSSTRPPKIAVSDSA